MNMLRNISEGSTSIPENLHGACLFSDKKGYQELLKPTDRTSHKRQDGQDYYTE